MKSTTNLKIEGTVSPGFESVRDAFVANFLHRGERGGACCIYQGGEKVVDLWGGIRDRASGDPWRQDTMVIIHSATKGLAAMVMALAHSRGWLDYDERVATYWPEFAQAGKERITVRQLLAHQAGLFAFDEPVDRAVIADLDQLAAIMARQRPAWAPGEQQAYHAITLGFYEGELLRRIDPAHRSLGRFFADEIAGPLGLDLYLRVPADLPDQRLARLEPPGRWKMLTGMPPSMLLAAMNRRSVLHRSLIANPGTGFYLDPQRICVRELEAPSGLGVGSAHGIAKAYGVFAAGGAALGLRAETLAELVAPARPARRGFHDACFGGPARFSLGFMKPSESFPFGPPSAFGAPGAGGAMGYADPATGIGYGYVTNQMGATLSGDPRDVALRAAIPTSPRRARPQHSQPEKEVRASSPAPAARTGFARGSVRLAALVAGVAFLVGIFAFVARPWFLRWGATTDEQQRPLPGDEIVPGATNTSTRAITIDAPAATVFAWLAQTGQDRAGFYSYELLEDLVGCEMPNVQHLDPALQQWKLGDKLWMYPPHKAGGAGSVPLATLVPGRALGFGMHQLGTPPNAPRDGSWSWVVEPIDADTSRLLMRGRGAGGLGWFPQTLAAGILDPVVFVMERKMMTSLATLAEGGRVPRWADDGEVALWTITFITLIASAALVLAGRRPRRRLATFVAAGLLLQLLTFVQPSLALGVPLVAALVLAAWGVRRAGAERRLPQEMPSENGPAQHFRAGRSIGDAPSHQDVA